MRNSLWTQSWWWVGAVVFVVSLMVVKTCANGYSAGGGGGYSYPVPRTPLEYPSYERKSTRESISLKKLQESIERQRDRLREEEKRVEEQERFIRRQRKEHTEVERQRTRERERDFLRFRDIQESVKETFSEGGGGGREREYRDENIRDYRYKDIDDGYRPPVDKERNRERIREEISRDRLRERERTLRERLNNDERYKPRDKDRTDRTKGEYSTRIREETRRPGDDDKGRRGSSRESSTRNDYSRIPDEDDEGGRGRVSTSTTTVTRGSSARGPGYEEESGSRRTTSEETIRSGSIFSDNKPEIVEEGEKFFKIVRYVEELDEFGNVIPGSRRIASSTEIKG